MVVPIRPGQRWIHGKDSFLNVYVTNVGKDSARTIEYDWWDGETTHLGALPLAEFVLMYYNPTYQKDPQ